MTSVMRNGCSGAHDAADPDALSGVDVVRHARAQAIEDDWPGRADPASPLDR
jgi:hypothetical protein